MAHVTWDRPVADMSKSASMRAAVCEAYREASRTPTIVAARIEKASADNLIITSRCRLSDLIVFAKLENICFASDGARPILPHSRS